MVKSELSFTSPCHMCMFSGHFSKWFCYLCATRNTWAIIGSHPQEWSNFLNHGGVAQFSLNNVHKRGLKHHHGSWTQLRDGQNVIRICTFPAWLMIYSLAIWLLEGQNDTWWGCSIGRSILWFEFNNGEQIIKHGAARCGFSRRCSTARIIL